jgi:hypothetical protein
MATKPLTYWTETEQTVKLSERFGSLLDELTTREKVVLRAVLSNWSALVMTEPRMLLNAAFIHTECMWQSSCVEEQEYGLCTQDVIDAVRILEGISLETANYLIAALCDFIDFSK